MRHEEKLLFISSCLISFSLFFLLGEKTMKLNNDAVENRCYQITPKCFNALAMPSSSTDEVT